MSISAIVTDIEGTTSSIDFVHEVLFPYAANALPDFLREHHGETDVDALLASVREEAGEPGADVERIIAILLEWIAADRKATGLKGLQGLVWQHGYENGDFTGHVYADAVAGLRRWADAGIDLYVYSSGSVAAQKLLFGFSDAGDLTPLFRGYFDTHIGHKREADAYRRIVEALERPAADILFLSDVAAELDAAADAGMRTIQLVRDDTIEPGRHRIVQDFDAILLD